MKQQASNTDYLIINIAKSLELCSESDGLLLYIETFTFRIFTSFAQTNINFKFKPVQTKGENLFQGQSSALEALSVTVFSSLFFFCGQLTYAIKY